ncbi:hypothetical protein PHMEG_0006331 [Phytophthora megakarya]|uniref:Uncharacterized protein n=1 Tax=Phytophthora megakarya TaxID=4795 RepID=A0A225WPF6_9STRA|nr:hypothetical protein PHMEG_0006331 [Phytophthora megakarya]
MAAKLRSEDDHEERKGYGETAPRRQEPDPNVNEGENPAMVQMTAFATVMQQVLTATKQTVVASMTQLNERLAHLETGSNTGTLVADAADGPHEPEPVRRVVEREAITLGQRRERHGVRGDDDGDDSDWSDNGVGHSSSAEEDDDADPSDSDGSKVEQPRRPPSPRGTRTDQRNRRRVIRDLELPSFIPTETTSVSTWIARIDLALEGARISGRGDWTDSNLYYILGNKLQDQPARWWVQLDQELRDRDRTWT